RRDLEGRKVFCDEAVRQKDKPKQASYFRTVPYLVYKKNSAEVARMKIITVNLNPCIDWQYSVQNFTHGGLNRVRRTREDIAGKGINVAIALKNLGASPLCTGFNFAENGGLLTSKLDACGISHDFIEVPGAIRTNIKMYEESTGEMTELNQPGAFVPEEFQEKLLCKLKNFDKNAILVLSGSRPQGVPADFYAKICRDRSGTIFLDTEGEALRLAIETGKIFAVKPNLFELEALGGKTFSKVSPQNLPKLVCISMGADGAVMVTQGGETFAPALDVEVRGVAGAGDAMVAGMVYALATGAPQEDFLRYAVAAAAASVALDGTQMCTREGFDKMRNKISMQ
ncbi:MAG: 1-phosphofructokinase family hexose kinase, partial [Defluviitaleaceae bacterium]|nr:1-phosphofructokinase family hexose kinase [Defluviitaleaceae bacterium]